MFPRIVNIVRIAIVAIMCVGLCASCTIPQSVQQYQPTAAKIAKAAKVYVQGSTRFDAKTKVLAITAFDAVVTGKLDVNALLVLGDSYLTKPLPQDQLDTLANFLIEVRKGDLSVNTIKPLAINALNEWLIVNNRSLTENERLLLSSAVALL